MDLLAICALSVLLEHCSMVTSFCTETIIVVVVNKQPQVIHYDRDIDEHNNSLTQHLWYILVCTCACQS